MLGRRHQRLGQMDNSMQTFCVNKQKNFDTIRNKCVFYNEFLFEIIMYSNHLDRIAIGATRASITSG